jgi:hypothetical protein
LSSLQLARVELIEHGHQNQRDNHPNCDALKIIQNDSLIRHSHGPAR